LIPSRGIEADYHLGANMRRITAVLALLLFPPPLLNAQGVASSRLDDWPTYRHAYYLFLSGTPNGCEECYVPLLVTTESLEQAAKATEKEACVLITTYERDSIWHNEGTVLIAPGGIEVAPRFVHLRGRNYRYQEISSAEALKLFENPMGTIPISRPLLPKAGSPGPTLEDLISAFRGSK
jgi:hypothetical protein